MVHRKSSFFMLVLVLIMIFIFQSAKAAGQRNSLFYEGEDFSVELSFTDQADISEDATLEITEFYKGSKEYQDYFSQTDDYVKLNMDQELTDARFFDICILEGDKKIEPDDTVKVSITCEEGMEKDETSELSVIHFEDEGKTELLEVRQEVMKEDVVSQISFEEDSFSVFGMIVFDSVDSAVRDTAGEVITDTVSVEVCKEWSDGYEVHEEDEVTITLYELSGKTWSKCDELILSAENDWQDKFENLDRSKEYKIKETKIFTSDNTKKQTYQSEIENTSVKGWRKKGQNTFADGENIVFIYKEDRFRILRKSSNMLNLNLKAENINILEHEEYGTYCKRDIQPYEMWKSSWIEEKQAWLLSNVHSNMYLSLIYDTQNDLYQWNTSEEIVEGSYLSFEDGEISATVNGVTKYLGGMTGEGPYTGLDKGDSGIANFSLFSYQIMSPGKYIITNTKNESVDEEEIQADILTEKTIDYLGDGRKNPDTDIEDNGSRRDIYRLNLNLEMKTDVTGLDLLMVLDVSSSMNSGKDCKDADGKFILRSEALRQAMNQFIPAFLPEDTKNRVCVVAFENESMILTDWTSDAELILTEVNREVDGELPLYSGNGTNYEAALIRAHEALTKRGYSGNAKAMIFLSDGQPTVHVYGNDVPEPGNVTVNLGTVELIDAGIKGTLPEELKNISCAEINQRLYEATQEAIASFKNHNPEIMIGTIAFNTKITEHLRILATDAGFVTQIQNGTPNDLIEAMELITDFVPQGICLTDELSEYVELYEEPDFKVVSLDSEKKETILFEPDAGLTEDGKEILEGTDPITVDGKIVKLQFRKDFPGGDGYQYGLSFNVKASQTAYDEFADANGTYPHVGDDQTDFAENETSSGKAGFYSNGELTKVSYILNGAVNERNYRKPVIQVQEGSFSLRKTDLEGNIIQTGAEFTLYRQADEGDADAVTIPGQEGEFVKAAEGITDENGELSFQHLRLKVFDEGYPYYLVETKAPDGYVCCKDAIVLRLFSDRVEIAGEDEGNDHPWCYVDKDGTSVIRNAEEVEPQDIPVTGGKGNTGIYLLGIMLMTGGIYLCLKRKDFQKY